MPALRYVVHAVNIYLAGPHSYPGMIAEVMRGRHGVVFLTQGDKAAMKI